MYAPTTAVRASEAPAGAVVASLLPQSVIDVARSEVETPALPLPAAAPSKSESDVANLQARTASLSELVGRHAAVSTPDREAECLAVAVYYESKGEPLDGQLAVAKTIINRSRSGRFPASLCGVVLQKGQFSFVRGGLPNVPRSSTQWKTAVAIGHIARNNLWNSGVQNALFFHARYVSPGWRLTRIGAVGNHIFYR